MFNLFRRRPKPLDPPSVYPPLSLCPPLSDFNFERAFGGMPGTARSGGAVSSPVTVEVTSGAAPDSLAGPASPGATPTLRAWFEAHRATFMRQREDAERRAGGRAVGECRW